MANGHTNGAANGEGLHNGDVDDGKIFVASVSPQTRASIAATFGIPEKNAGYLIEQLLSGPRGVKSGGTYRSGFTWVIDTNTVRDAALVLAADEVAASLDLNSASSQISVKPKKPILTSACPGWICYAEKTHPYVLPHLSRLKSPQALAGTLIKSILSQKYNIPPHKVWHLAIMPCFDKKLEASRTELTSTSWLPQPSSDAVVRDIDCVITARELIHLAAARGIDITSLPSEPVSHIEFPDPKISSFLFPRSSRPSPSPSAGSSGGYVHHIIHTLAAAYPGTEVRVERGRNADVLDYKLVHVESGKEVLKMARYYGFRNIQNLVRRLKPKAASRMPGAVRRGPGARNGSDLSSNEYAYVEVMACPGGCTNGGGQVKIGEVAEIKQGSNGVDGTGQPQKPGPKEQKEWLAKVDEAYFSASSDDEESEAMDVDSPRPQTIVGSNGESFIEVDQVNGISHHRIHSFIDHWASITGIEKEKLLWTSFREVESDVGKKKTKKSDMDRVVGLASSVGGGW